MCGRFTGNDGKDVFPGGEYELISAHGASDMKWGFAFDRRTVINVRAETLTAKFGRAFNEGRGVLSVKGFYEWSPQKNKFYYTSDGDELLLCAIFRREKRSDDRSKYVQIGFFDGDDPNRSDDLDRFVIITTQANEYVSPVHHRMPLIVSRERADDWLNDENFARRFLHEECRNAVRAQALY